MWNKLLLTEFVIYLCRIYAVSVLSFTDFLFYLEGFFFFAPFFFLFFSYCLLVCTQLGCWDRCRLATKPVCCELRAEEYRAEDAAPAAEKEQSLIFILTYLCYIKNGSVGSRAHRRHRLQRRQVSLAPMNHQSLAKAALSFYSCRFALRK